MELPIAYVTVEFDDLVTGEQLAIIMQHVVNWGFLMEPRHHDGLDCFELGRSTANKSLGARLAPSLTDPPVIVWDEIYEKIVVCGHNYPTDYCQGEWSPRLVIEYVKKLAQEIKDAYQEFIVSGYPDFEEPPQSFVGC